MCHRHPGTFDRLELAWENQATHNQKSSDPTENPGKKVLLAPKHKGRKQKKGDSDGPTELTTLCGG
jgi:hypothetical protein